MMNFFAVWRIACILALGSCLEIVISLLLIRSQHRHAASSHYRHYSHQYRLLAVKLAVKGICRSTAADDADNDDDDDGDSHLDSECIDHREDSHPPTIDTTTTIKYPYNNNSSSSILNKFKDKSVLILGMIPCFSSMLM